MVPRANVDVVTSGGGGSRSGTVGGRSDASFGFYLREAFQIQTNTENMQ